MLSLTARPVGLVSISGMVGNPSPSGEAEWLSVTHSAMERMERSASSGRAQTPCLESGMSQLLSIHSFALRRAYVSASLLVRKIALN